MHKMNIFHNLHGFFLRACAFWHGFVLIACAFWHGFVLIACAFWHGLGWYDAICALARLWVLQVFTNWHHVLFSVDLPPPTCTGAVAPSPASPAVQCSQYRLMQHEEDSENADKVHILHNYMNYIKCIKWIYSIICIGSFSELVPFGMGLFS